MTASFSVTLEFKKDITVRQMANAVSHIKLSDEFCFFKDSKGRRVLNPDTGFSLVHGKMSFTITTSCEEQMDAIKEYVREDCADLLVSLYITISDSYEEEVDLPE